MIDTHIYINSEVIQNVDKEIIKIQNSKYVDKVVNVGTNMKTCKEALMISEKYDKFFTAI